MPTKNNAGATEWVDPDDAPELTDEWFAQADEYDGKRLVRRGRPPVVAPRQQVTLRLEPAVIEALRATGPGWQTRVNDALKEWLARR
jgi:uncharacterized protein (DUF4415 family)